MGSNSASSGGGGSNRYEPPKKKNIVQKIFEASPTVKVFKAISKNIKETKQKKNMQNALDYEGDALGTKSSNTYATDNTGGGSDNNSNTVVPLATAATAPTTAEVAQATATDATDTTSTEDTIDIKKKKTKATGRSMTILKSAQGITDQGLTLGKRSLLGS